MENKPLWVALAIFIGVLLALLPLPIALFVLTTSILVVLALIDVRVALIVTLFVSLLKVLLETEIPSLAALPLDVGQLLLLFTFGVWFAHAAVRRKRFFFWTPFYIPLLIFILLALPSFWNTLSLESSIKELAKWIEILVIIAVVLSLTEVTSYRLIAAIIVAACVQALIGIYQFFGGSGEASFWILDYQRFWAFGSFGNPDPFAGFMSLGLCVVIGALFDCLSRFLSQFRQAQIRFDEVLLLILAMAAVGLLSLGLLFSWSRGAWVGFAVALAAMLVCLPRKIGIVLLLTVIVVVSLALASHLVPASIVSRLERI
jgi:hypothetical protein